MFFVPGLCWQFASLDDTVLVVRPRSGMLSAGMDHLVDQIVNPKIYHVFTPEVENGVRQYLGLSLPREASQPPAQLADMDSVGCALPHAAPLQKSEFSIGI